MVKSNYDPEIHYRRSIRRTGHNYASSGAYFVTMCAKNREPLFEQPILRRILEEVWGDLPQHFRGLELDEFVIMPDHIHFIVWLDSTISAGTTLSDVIQSYKSSSLTKWHEHINVHDLNVQVKFWQINYVEHVIRNQNELIQTRAYIQNDSLKTQQNRASTT